MGQRLNIEIVKGNETLANAYYHWSGYTSSALNLTDRIIARYRYNDQYNHTGDDVLFAIRLLEDTGAGLTEKELNYAIEKYGNLKFKKCDGRNEGLIAITEREMQNTRNWEEARVTIDIEKETIDFEAVGEIDKNYYQELKEDNEIFYETNIKLKNVKFEDFFNLQAFFYKAEYLNQHNFKNNYNNSYFYIIE